MNDVTCKNCFTINPLGRTMCVKCGAPLKPMAAKPGKSEFEEGPPRTSTSILQLKRGQVVAKRYTLKEIIGRGGMGCIFRVRDNTLNEDVALKMLLPEHVQDTIVLERFFNEARIARQLSHRNIVRVHDIGIADDMVYISMEYLEGKSLRETIEALGPGQRLPIKSTLHIFDELCGALEYAHQYTIHRDIKPENVMICSDGTIKLMDFGISKLMSVTRLTQASMVMGTPFYMSPEQLKNSADVDARADIYSMGVMLYEILTGTIPTGLAKPASQMLRDVPPSLDPIVAKCLESKPEDRFASAAELRKELKLLQRDVVTDPDSKQEKKKLGKLVPLKPVMGSVLLLIILGIAGMMMRSFEMERRRISSNTPASGPVEGITVPSRQSGQASAQSSIQASEFSRIRSLIARAKNVAPDAAYMENRGDLKKGLAVGEALWQRAQQENGLGRSAAVDTARAALQCYAAPVLAKERSEMSFIPQGKVRVGVASGEVLVNGFFIDRREVTQADFDRFASDTGWPRRADNPPELPVVMVTFYDALAYAAWAEKALPTEAQWAQAAYGAYDTSSIYPWGSDWDEGFRNDSGALEKPGEYENDLTASGCYDMSGNVAEWTRSAYDEGAYRPNDSRQDFAHFKFGTPIVVRGGHYLDADGIALDSRPTYSYESFTPWVGFRCVWEFPWDLNEIEALLAKHGA